MPSPFIILTLLTNKYKGLTMKDKVVVFKEKVGARIYVNPGEDFIQALRQQKTNFLVNPDLSSLAGVPPERWQIENNKVVSNDKTVGPQKTKQSKLVLYKTPS